jgi:hypothetical protein
MVIFGIAMFAFASYFFTNFGFSQKNYKTHQKFPIQTANLVSVSSISYINVK